MPAEISSPIPTAKIGPNALIQTVRATQNFFPDRVVQTLHYADQPYLLEDDPQHMVDEVEVVRLVQALVAVLGFQDACAVLTEAGRLTGGYLLENRIPGLFQAVLLRLPSRMALRLLLWAVGLHAWTFVGSGTFAYRVGRVAELTVVSSITPADAMRGFYFGAFKRLIHTLIDPYAIIATQLHAPATCVYTIQFNPER